MYYQYEEMKQQENESSVAKNEFIWCEEENCGETLWYLSELKILRMKY